MSRKKKPNTKPKSTSPVIDICIVTGGRFDLLTKCIKALEREAEKTPLAIYIIDNASDSEERIQNSELFMHPLIKSRRLTQEVGFAQANNEAARLGSSPLIMFLNDDVELQEGAIQKVIDTFKDETVGTVGIKLLFPEDSTRPGYPAGKVQHVGIGINMRGDAEHPLIGWSPSNPKTCISRDVAAITGACLTIRRVLFNKAQGFDPVYGLGTWEDVDLCFKVRALGFRNYVNVKALGYHYTNGTVEKKRRGFPIQYNKLIFQARWAPTGILAWTSQDFW